MDLRPPAKDQRIPFPEKGDRSWRKYGVGQEKGGREGERGRRGGGIGRGTRRKGIDSLRNRRNCLKEMKDFLKRGKEDNDGLEEEEIESGGKVGRGGMGSVGLHKLIIFGNF